MKKKYHHGDLRNALLEAGLEILSKEGVEALTLREAARRAGVTHAAPYRHFADKDAMLAAIAERGYRLLGEAQDARTARVKDPLQRLEELGVAYVLFAVANPSYYRLMFGTVTIELSEYPELVETSRAAMQRLLDVISEIQQGDPRETAVTAWSLVHGVASLWIDNRLKWISEKSPEQIARDAIGVLIRGMKASKRG